MTGRPDQPVSLEVVTDRIECAVLGCGTAVEYEGDVCGECVRKGEIVIALDQAIIDLRATEPEHESTKAEA